MKSCHSCYFFNNGWCNYRNQGASSGGGCSHWCGSSNGPRSFKTKTNKKTYKRKPKIAKKSILACGTCIWWDKGECINPDSQAYHRVMTSGSLCTAYQNQKGDTLKKFSSQVIEKTLAENKKENLRTVKPNKSTSNKKNSQSKHPKKESISEKNGNQAKRVYWKNTIRYSCGSCAWWEYETCTNKSSSVCGEKMKRGALCTRYQHEKTDPLLEFKNGIVEFVMNEHKKEDERKARAQYSHAREKTQQHDIISRKQEKGERCNRCKFLFDNRCMCKDSNCYEKKVVLTSWCIWFECR